MSIYLIPTPSAFWAGLCKLPEDLNWRHMTGMGMLVGIGFTMSIFISNLAFTDSRLIQNSKVAILTASVVASIAGLIILSGKRRVTIVQKHEDLNTPTLSVDSQKHVEGPL